MMARASKYEGKRDEVLALIGGAALRHSKPPTVRLLAEEAGVGVATMHSYLTKLAQEGLVEWRPGKHRSLALTPQGSQRLSSPGAPSV